MKKKNIKTKLSISLSVLIICFLISTSSLNIVNSEALLERENIQYNIDSYDLSTLKWIITEVVSTESTANSYNPSLAVDNLGNVHVAWDDITNYAGSGGDRDIFYKRWDSSSSSWTITEVVSTESTLASEFPTLNVDTLGNVHVAWTDYTDYADDGTDVDIFYKRWDSSSSSWTITEVVSTESTSHSQYSSLGVDSAGNVHVVWQDYSDYNGAGTDVDIFYKRLDSSSSSWTTTEVVSTESTGHSQYPSLGVDSAGNVHVAWGDTTNYAGAGTGWDVFYKRLNSSTSAWITTEVVSTESTGPALYPSLGVDLAGNIHVAWHDWTDYAGAGTDYDIFYKLKKYSSSSWTITEVVSTESTGHSYYPSIAVDSAGIVHVAWGDDTDYAGSGTGQDVFYKRKDSYSFSWTTTELVFPESIANSYNPSLAVDSAGNGHIACEDTTNYAGSGTDLDLYYNVLTGHPAPPELAFILPSTSSIDAVSLDWNNVPWADSYTVYRSISYIWSVEGLIPIASVTSSDYIDTVPSEGFYYYVVVAGNLAGNSSLSNCQYVEHKIPDLEAPELAPLLPNPTEIDSVSLVWNNVDGATEYYIYRSNVYIWSVEGLTPIATVVSNSFIDTLPDENYYFYVIVATDGVRNSTHSNCEYIEYKLPTLAEFILISSLAFSALVIIFAVFRYRKKKME